MNAIEFVKKYGLGESAKITNESIEFGKNVFYDLSDELYYGSDFGGRICVNDLKQIVDAFDRVMEHGSVELAKKYAESEYTAPEVKEFLSKAIKLVEQCQ